MADIIAHTTAAGLTGGTSANINTTNATALIAWVSYNTGGTPAVADSKSNTWTPLNPQDTTTDAAGQFFYVASPTVGSGHNFTCSGGLAMAMEIIAVRGPILGAPFDQQNGAIVLGNTAVSTGSVTPSQNNEFLVAGITFAAINTVAIDNSFAITDQQNFNPGTSYGSAIAWKQQGTAAAINPSWTWGSSTNAAVAIATFKVTPLTVSAAPGTPTNTQLAFTSSPSGGFSSYTYQWYRDTTANFTPGVGNILSGATSQNLTDNASLVFGTYYYYIVRVTDSVGQTADSNQVAGTLLTTPLVIYMLGDSITKSTAGPTPPSSTLPQLMAIELAKLYRQRSMTVINGGVDGASAHDYATDTGGILTAALSSMTSNSATYCSVLLGANDAAAHRTASQFKTDLQTIGTAVIANGQKMIIHYPTYIPAGANSGATDTAATALTQQYLPQIDSLVDGSNYYQGDQLTYGYIMNHQSEVQSDQTHLLQTGEQSVTVMEARAIDRSILNPASPGGTSSGGIEIFGG